MLIWLKLFVNNTGGIFMIAIASVLLPTAFICICGLLYLFKRADKLDKKRLLDEKKQLLDEYQLFFQGTPVSKF